MHADIRAEKQRQRLSQVLTNLSQGGWGKRDISTTQPGLTVLHMVFRWVLSDVMATVKHLWENRGGRLDMRGQTTPGLSQSLRHN